jgi:hypothetical protein
MVGTMFALGVELVGVHEEGEEKSAEGVIFALASDPEANA